tara:strand:+ start:338 stop:1597 length:1260 start_codon:yes stop_codon:yes gene_type:complete
MRYIAAVETLAHPLAAAGATITTSANGSPPSSPSDGDFWYNTTYKQFCIYISVDGSNSAWHTFTDEAEGNHPKLMNSPGLGYSFQLYGRYVVGLLSLVEPGVKAVCWNKSLLSTHTGANYASGVGVVNGGVRVLSNTIRGVMFGGQGGLHGAINVRTINYWLMAPHATEAAKLGDLTADGTSGVGINHATRGVMALGRSVVADGNQGLDVIEYITIGSDGDATDFGNLVRTKSKYPAVSSTVRGVIGGGRQGDAATVVNEMDYVTIASAGNATDFGNLTEAKQNMAAVNSTTRGVWIGGCTSTDNFSTTYVGTSSEVIEYITIGTTGNATDFGNLRAAFHDHNATSTGTKGMFHDNIFTIATAANATYMKDILYNGQFEVVPIGVLSGNPSHLDGTLEGNYIIQDFNTNICDGWIAATG